MKVIIDGIEYIPAQAIAADASACDRALQSPMHSYDLQMKGATILDYLHELLKTLWIEEGEFNGKSPLGNSGWAGCLIGSLVVCGYIPGTCELNDDGSPYNVQYDRGEAHRLVKELIAYAFYRG